MALFEAFATAVRAAGARPTVVIFPDRQSVTEAQAGRSTILTPLIRELAARGIDHVDLTRAFVDSNTPGDVNMGFMRGGHYSPVGNRIMALWPGKEILARAASAASNDDVLRARRSSAPGQSGACPAEVVRQGTPALPTVADPVARHLRQSATPCVAGTMAHH